jgi:ACR3 family arsenite transporter
VRYELKTPWRNGTTHVIFEPLDFMYRMYGMWRAHGCAGATISRLVALVPKPRVNLTRFHGVFAPYADIGITRRTVSVGSNLSDGHPGFTLSQVALNDLIMVFAFAPIVALLLGISSIHVPWSTLFLSVVLYIVLPVVVASLWRKWLMRDEQGETRLKRVLDRMHPVSLSALLITLVLLFGFQGGQITSKPIIILLLAIPIVIQVYFNSGLAYWLNKKLGEEHCVAAPSALIGASNFFELAVAAAISIFGLQSGAALATVVGVLVEVPVMLSVVWIVNRTKPWYEARA